MLLQFFKITPMNENLTAEQNNQHIFDSRSKFLIYPVKFCSFYFWVKTVDIFFKISKILIAWKRVVIVKNTIKRINKAVELMRVNLQHYLWKYLRPHVFIKLSLG